MATGAAAGYAGVVEALAGAAVGLYAAPFEFTGRLDKVTVTMDAQEPLDGEAKKLNTGEASPNSSFFVDMATSSTGAIAFAVIPWPATSSATDLMNASPSFRSNRSLPMVQLDYAI